MTFRAPQLISVMLLAALAGCLGGGQPGSAPGASPTSIGPGAASPGDVSGPPAGGEAGGGGGALPGDGSSGEEGGPYFYSADYDATASTAKPLPGGAVATGGVWEGAIVTAVTAKGAVSRCTETVHLANGTSQTEVQYRLQGQILADVTTGGPIEEDVPPPGGCLKGQYLHAVEKDGDTLIGCTYFPLTSNCRFGGNLNYLDADNLRFYVYFNFVTLYPGCEPVPLLTLDGTVKPESFYVEAQDEIVIPVFRGTPPECPSRSLP